MSWLDEIMGDARREKAERSFARAVVDTRTWERAAARLAEGQCTLMGLWGEPDAAHLALLEDGRLGVLSLDCPRGTFPSVAKTHAPALRLERTMVDLYGLAARGSPDHRRWLDHGRWSVRQPLGEPKPAADEGDAYEFHKAEGVPLHQIPVGPVHAGIIEPGHFRFTANGETVVRLEERLGYVHKGVEQLMLGAPLDRAAKLAGRVSGDSTVAYSVAFARAVENAAGVEAPARAHALRGVMAELERLANHFGDIGAICNDASFSLIHAHCGILREHVLRVADFCFGHRLMMDRVAPGGVTVDLTRSGVETLRSLILNIRKRFPELMELYDGTASLQQRTVTTGFLSANLARQYGAGGFVGRASGRAFDARKTPGYPPYAALAFEVPVRTDGDVHGRLSVRAVEVTQSVSLIERIVEDMPDGAIDMSGLPPPKPDAEGLALVEGFRGDILAWVRLGPDGTVARCHLRDPSWFQWPLLEAAIEGNIVADFPLCNKSFNCSYSGHDL